MKASNTLLIILTLIPITTFGNALQEQRILFSQAEKLLQQGDSQTFLAKSAPLTNYPLYPYLQYQWLKNQLQDTDRIHTFIKAHPNNYYAILLRNKWLDYLAKQQRWLEFSQSYQADGNTARECQFFWAQYKIGNRPMALAGAKHLWATDSISPQECDPLFSVFTPSAIFTSDLAWQRFEMAITNDKYELAEYLRQLLPASDQEIAGLWLQVHKKPTLITNRNFLPLNHKLSGRIFTHGINKLAQFNLEQAIAVWDDLNQAVTIDGQNILQIENKLALALAYQRDKRAYSRLAQLSSNDEKVNEWRIRAALWEQNWQHVGEALARLTNGQHQQPIWQYWQARCYEALGNKPAAQRLYLQLAEDRSFYGFLAADLLDKPYRLADKPVFFMENQLATLLSEDDFKAIQELKFFNRELDARRLWFFATSKLDKGRLKVAAKLAQQWQWDQLAIMTLAKADYWDDMALRFPLRYPEQVNGNASRLSIDPAFVFALIRQESMLHNEAVSPAGARGLMQVMPATAKLMADKLHEPWLSDNYLFNPDFNIRYGSRYFKQLLERFDNHYALAIAAYNAGPNRVTKWLPLKQTIPADIWIETIPYEETRKYVTAVFFYTMIYQLRIEKSALKLKNLLYTIKPN